MTCVYKGNIVQLPALPFFLRGKIGRPSAQRSITSIDIHSLCNASHSHFQI